MNKVNCQFSDSEKLNQTEFIQKLFNDLQSDDQHTFYTSLVSLRIASEDSITIPLF